MKIFPIKEVAKVLPALAALSASIGWADEQRLPWRLHHQEQGVWKFGFEAQSFSTQSNFGPSGDIQDVTGLAGLRRTEVAGTLDLGIHPRLTLFGRGSWNNTQIESSTLNGNQYGLADQSLGLSLRLLDATAALDFQVQADLPSYNNAESQAQQLPFLGDASTNVHLGGFLSLPFSQNASSGWALSGGAGYTMRTGNFSSSIPWSLEISRTPSLENAGWMMRALAWGFASLGTDPNGTEGSTTLRQNGSAGSYLVNAINPSIFVAQAELGYRFSPSLGISLGGSMPIWGQAVAKGVGIQAGLEWNIDRLKGTSGSFRARKQSGTFVTYAAPGKVKAVSSTRTVIIDQGSHQGLALGDRIDIFSVTPEGSLGQTVARGQVTQLDWDQSQVTLLEVYREIAIKEGFAVQKPVQP